MIPSHLVPTVEQCAMCQERGKTWGGENPKCFLQGFEDNWNCATLNAIRNICFEGNELPGWVDYQYCDDEKYATIRISEIDIERNPLALWVQWYKSRGHTQALWLLYSDRPPKQPNEDELLSIINYWPNGRKS